MSGKRRIQGVLFDMDGLVLDTEKLYTRFWQEAAHCLGYPMTREQALGMRSMNRKAGEALIKSYFGPNTSYLEIRSKRMELMDAFIEKEGVALKPGIHELLHYLKEHGIRTAIATSSPLERTLKYLASVNMENSFDAITSVYMVEHGKPEPDIYIYAAHKLGLNPGECLALEDSPSGLTAARKAGCLPVMIPDQDQPDEETKKLLFTKVERLDDVIGVVEELNRE
ncbi:MAG: HAD family phosphatase [Lachnospiraceae bacterium]|nr:HAD family phosphatase [Lachnospiraceae bacterium]